MVTMAEPWRHPETGMYYLRRQIPKPLRDELGSGQLWKRSLETKDPAEARRAFTRLNAELEARFAAARTAIAQRVASKLLNTDQADAAVARACALHHGSRFDRFPTLFNLFFAEEAAASILGGGLVAGFTGMSPAALAEMDPDHLPGDLWLRVINTRSRTDIQTMAQHMLAWVTGEYQKEGGFGDIARTDENDRMLVTAITAAVEREQAALRIAISSPFRSTGSRLRPDMTLDDLLEEWKTKTPAPGRQGAHETSTTIADFIDFIGNMAVAQINGDHLYDFRDAVAALPKAMPMAVRNLTFNARLAACREIPGPKVAPASVKRRVGHLQALLTYAFNQRWISTNTGSGIRIDGYSKSTGGRRPFLDDELTRLFASDLFLKPQTWSETRTSVGDLTLVWLFLLGLTNGARIEEIGQTELSKSPIGN